MYYSISLNDKKFAFFINYLNNIIEGDTQYEDIIKPIISDAHALAIGTKDYYSIDRYGFPLIVFLVEKEKEYFKTIDLENINSEDYKHILSVANQVNSEINYI